MEDANDSQIKHENTQSYLSLTTTKSILVFHEDDLLDEATDYILTCVNNPISFNLADFSTAKTTSSPSIKLQKHVLVPLFLLTTQHEQHITSPHVVFSKK
mmetsp:Transcript_49537/g.59956  ORF Transcript_49537/g.59956 Transcript_49537/m.59956 type:complete len:100 (+) Transcript_49537:386-685(+)